ncbi:hypothetical protein COC42_07975 [Sphingomonas spermidinifaciens]|uniref:DUF3325 domain-containing protein n=1 Tax=Sphingomonas spermidinifaciens TaxID=1141889 RepID=A0A2A4B981_9SPHN|nr:DUF3325 family protein [Sphingomonas spermidinifaciens]PCD04216.1 hypothetical protein COC42_07975 [Sphingomonas spermidinifaciens]
MSAFLFLGALLSALTGCALLALSQARHWQAVTGSLSVARPGPRRSGYVLVATSLLLTVLLDGAGFAALFWPLLSGAAVLATAAVLAISPGLLRPLARLWEARPPGRR